MKWIRRVLLALFVFWLVFCAILWVALGQLFDGGSRALSKNAFYTELLAHPRHHSVQVQTMPCAKNTTQCIVIESALTKGFDSRYGEPIRKQLRVRGFTPPVHGQHIGWLVMLHGKGSRKEELIPAAMRYVGSGFRVILLDLPAHGENKTPLTWGAEAHDGDIVFEALNEVKAISDDKDLPTFLWGLSLGGMYANRTAYNHPDAFSGMIIVASFDRLESVLRQQITFLPKTLQNIVLWHARQIAQLRGFDIEKSAPSDWAKQIDIPILQIHGDKDNFIPFASGKRLFDSYASSDKQWITVTGANHQRVFATAQPVFADTISWLYRHIGNQ